MNGLPRRKYFTTVNGISINQGLRGSKLTVIIPAAHTKTNVKNRPLPESRSKIVLLVGVGHKRIVGSHHGHVKVNEVLEERRLVVTRVARREPLVSVTLDIPVSVDIARVVLLDARGLDLLETPLWQVDVTGTEVAPKILVLESQSSRECSDPRVVP